MQSNRGGTASKARTPAKFKKNDIVLYIKNGKTRKGRIIVVDDNGVEPVAYTMEVEERDECGNPLLDVGGNPQTTIVGTSDETQISLCTW